MADMFVLDNKKAKFIALQTQWKQPIHILSERIVLLLLLSPQVY